MEKKLKLCAQAKWTTQNWIHEWRKALYKHKLSQKTREHRIGETDDTDTRRNIIKQNIENAAEEDLGSERLT